MFMLKIIDDYEHDWPNSPTERWLVWALLHYGFEAVNQYWQGTH